MPNSTTQAWTRDEVKGLISSMEGNQEQLRGKQIAWHKEVKEQIFGAEKHSTVKRIPEKMSNMKKIWKDASTIRVGS